MIQTIKKYINSIEVSHDIVKFNMELFDNHLSLTYRLWILSFLKYLHMRLLRIVKKYLSSDLPINLHILNEYFQEDIIDFLNTDANI